VSVLLECRALTKHYGRTRALDNIDLVLEAGPPIALVGPNGAGKTTLLSLLAGFCRPSGGDVHIFGEVPNSATLAGRRAALPQDALFDPSLDIARQLRLLAELQGFGRAAARQEVSRVLDVVGLAGSAKSLPTALSHGMRKRIAFGQALIGEPEMILLDEPTAGIDPENARALRDMIVSRAERTTFLISSHNLDELERLCGSVVQLEQGRLVRHEALSSVSATTMKEDADEQTLSLRLVDGATPADVEAALLGIPGVGAVSRTSDGRWQITVDDERRAAISLLEMLDSRGWEWRQISRGRTLEERLYGR